MQGQPRSVVTKYLAEGQRSNGERMWSREMAPGNESITLMAVRVLSSEGKPSGNLDSDHDAYVELEFLAGGKSPATRASASAST